jgi:hypothetical protein
VSNIDERRTGPQFQTAPLITGAALIGAGAVLAMVGIAVSGSHMLAAMRRWVNDMEVPPSEQARIKWGQAKAAAMAGARAWQEPPSSLDTPG